MKKLLLIALIAITGILAAILVACIYAILSPSVKKKSIETQTRLRPKSENIDSLMTLIRKDTHYPIDDVWFNHKDSSLFITITGEECSVRYFDTTYHIPDFQSIDGIQLLNTKNRGLDSESKRGIRSLAAFREKWCVGNECVPFTAQIKKQITVPDSYKSVRLWVNWEGDNSFTVVNLFQQKTGNGSIKTRRASAEIDMNGRIKNYYSQE